MIEHSAIPNDGRHEPKDIGLASGDTVYVADGLGSGDWAIPTWGRKAYAQIHTLSNATATTFSAVDTPTELAFGTSFVLGPSSQFIPSTDGRITYVGDGVVADCYAKVSATTSVAGTYEFYIAKNGTSIPESVVSVTFDGTNSEYFIISLLSSLVTNDYLELYCVAKTGTDDVTAQSGIFKVVGA